MTDLSKKKCFTAGQMTEFMALILPVLLIQLVKSPKLQIKCYVIHGLSTKYTIPCGYYFHSSMLASDFNKLTLNVLKLLTDCCYITLRIITDNMSSNVLLFKNFGGGEIKNCIRHPFLPGLPLFLSFDFCHALINARNLFQEGDEAKKF